ncbi:head-tail adaptor protein [Staphylococcus nepalensis]|uniref:phage head completion protein n=1 Tax=Staphylococcus TaxID=1279 RepID=UPI0035F58524
MRVSAMKDYIIFYAVTNTRPYPGMGGKENIYESWCEIYEPSTKDFQISSLETEKVNVTVVIRNVYPEFLPTVGHTFEVKTGMYKDSEFNIKNIAPKEENTLKIVGEKIWE